MGFWTAIAFIVAAGCVLALVASPGRLPNLTP